MQNHGRNRLGKLRRGDAALEVLYLVFDTEKGWQVITPLLQRVNFETGNESIF